jgi:hypothetical protein
MILAIIQLAIVSDRWRRRECEFLKQQKCSGCGAKQKSLSKKAFPDCYLVLIFIVY